MNRIVLVGRLTKDVELRRTGDGKAVSNFTLAVSRPFASDQTDFIPCQIWGKGAENIAKYCTKGSQVAVDGRLQQRNYQNKDGKNVQVFEVICESVQFLESKKQVEPTPQAQEVQNVQVKYDYDIEDDDIQF